MLPITWPARLASPRRPRKPKRPAGPLQRENLTSRVPPTPAKARSQILCEPLDRRRRTARAHRCGRGPARGRRKQEAPLLAKAPRGRQIWNFPTGVRPDRKGVWTGKLYNPQPRKQTSEAFHFSSPTRRLSITFVLSGRPTGPVLGPRRARSRPPPVKDRRSCGAIERRSRSFGRRQTAKLGFGVIEKRRFIS